MADPEVPDASPPEVPEEFAAAYREAYQRALEVEDAGNGGSRTASRFGPALVVLVLVLAVGAYAAGKVFSDDPGGPVAEPRPGGSEVDRSTARPTPSGPTASPSSGTGTLEPVVVGSVSAGCTAPPGQDSAGHPVTYLPANAVDGDPGTAWRCVGTAIGQKLTLTLAADVDVAEVGLIPGYAKTDPSSGADRYAENNRITRVRWTLADGETIVQRLDPDPANRAVQVLPVPPTTTDRIVLEILAVERGSRDTTAISELWVEAAR